MRARITMLGASIVAAGLLAACGSASTNAAADGSAGASTTSAAATEGSSATSDDTADVPGYTNPEVAPAKAITGVSYHPEPLHNHVNGVLAYNTTPPVGGNHSQYWADCSGTVYPNAIAE